MLVLDTDYSGDKAVCFGCLRKNSKADFPDIIGINRYYGWYTDMGYLDIINQTMVWDITLWKNHYKKPLLITEYGAEALSGLTVVRIFFCEVFQEPGSDFSVQYQDQVAKNSHAAFDVLKKNNIITGEMIWNFADFMTAQGN